MASIANNSGTSLDSPMASIQIKQGKQSPKVKYTSVKNSLLSFKYGSSIPKTRARSPTPSGVRVTPSPERRPLKANIILPRELNVSIFDEPIEGRNWQKDCALRDHILKDYARGHQQNAISHLWTLIREMELFLGCTNRQGPKISVADCDPWWIGRKDGWTDAVIDVGHKSSESFNKISESVKMDYHFLKGVPKHVRNTRLFNGPNYPIPGLAPVFSPKERPAPIRKIVPPMKMENLEMIVVNGKAIPKMSVASVRVGNAPFKRISGTQSQKQDMQHQHSPKKQFSCNEPPVNGARTFEQMQYRQPIHRLKTIWNCINIKPPNDQSKKAVKSEKCQNAWSTENFHAKTSEITPQQSSKNIVKNFASNKNTGIVCSLVKKNTKRQTWNERTAKLMVLPPSLKLEIFNQPIPNRDWTADLDRRKMLIRNYTDTCDRVSLVFLRKLIREMFQFRRWYGTSDQRKFGGYNGTETPKRQLKRRRYDSTNSNENNSMNSAQIPSQSHTPQLPNAFSQRKSCCSCRQTIKESQAKSIAPCGCPFHESHYDKLKFDDHFECPKHGKLSITAHLQPEPKHVFDSYEPNNIEESIISSSRAQQNSDLDVQSESSSSQQRSNRGQFTSNKCILCNKPIDNNVGYGELPCGHKVHWEREYFLRYNAHPRKSCIGKRCRKANAKFKRCSACQQILGLGVYETACYCATNDPNADTIHADELEIKLSTNHGKCSNCLAQHPGFCIMCKRLFALTENGPPQKVFLACCNSYCHRDCWYSQNPFKCPVPDCSMNWCGVLDVDYIPICGTKNERAIEPLPQQRGNIGGKSKRVDSNTQRPTSHEPSITQMSIDSMLMPPPSLVPRRTSSRVSNTPTLFSTPTSSSLSIKPVTTHCASAHSSHFGFGCGALSAKHLPIYYNSLQDLNLRCAHCDALLLPSEFRMEGGYPKCCAKGHVNLRVRFDDLQNWPAKLTALFNNKDTKTIRWIGKLRANAMAYNDNLAFGCVRIQRDDKLNQAYRIVKCNNMIRYVLWDFNPPTPDLPHLQGQLFTIPDADARLRIDAIAQEHHLDEELLKYLHDILREHHPFANVYKTASETFKGLEDADKINFRMLVVDTNKKGVEKTLDKTLATEEVEERQIRAIHPGRINVETAAGSKLVAEFYLDNGANVPPGQKYDVILHGKHGTGEHDMKWWNRNVEPTQFPLLFSRGQFAYEYGIKLKLAEKERFDPTYRQIRDADGDLMDDTELGEESEFLPPELERQIHRRDNVSRAQWFRYMCQIRGSDWKSSHWLWNWNNLAQLYTITYNNRIEAQKVQYMKQLQGQKRLVRVRALLQWVKQI